MESDNIKTHDYNKYAKKYSELKLEGNYYLSFRDIPDLLNNYKNNGNKVLDYGCGTGRSSRFLKSLGYEVIGADINYSMLKEAKKINPNGNYQFIESAKLPYDDESFDIVFSSYVFLEVKTFDEMIEILSEMKRVLKKDGFIIFVTSIVTNIKDKWVSFDYDFEENNKLLDKCERLKLLIKDKDIVLYDYNWTNEEYKEAIDKANLNLLRVYTPMGNDKDNIDWKDEEIKPYSYIYICSKNN